MFSLSGVTDLFGKMSGDCHVTYWEWTVVLSLCHRTAHACCEKDGGDTDRSSVVSSLIACNRVNDCGKMSDVYLLAIHSLLVTRHCLSESKLYTSDVLRRWLFFSNVLCYVVFGMSS